MRGLRRPQHACSLLPRAAAGWGRERTCAGIRAIATVRPVEYAEFPFEPEFAALRGLYDEIDTWLQRPPESLRRVAPDVSAWSVEHHLAHIALANELVARNLRSLLKGAGPFVVESGAPVPGALELLARGRFPRGKAQAPRIVRPPEAVERQYLLDWLAGNRRDFAELEPRIGELRETTKKVPHQLLGALSASQWTRFAACHRRHHLLIASEVDSAPILPR